MGGLVDDYRRALVIPAHREPAELLGALEPALEAASGRTLVIVVVNAACDVAERYRPQHEQLIAGLTAERPRVIATQPPMILSRHRHHDVLCIDRACPAHALPEGEGVGLARRIGCDVGLALYARGQIASPWLYNTDADASLPVGYFDDEPCERSDETAARVFRFEHVDGGDPTIHRATVLHELRLRYYVLGLASAHSPYAFHTVGSTLVVHADRYAAVRGFPRRLAGEDFYLLNKLAKLGAIRLERNPPVRLLSRPSLRTPHGTGTAAVALSELQSPDSLELYHPEAFRLLGVWLTALDRFAAAPRPGALERSLRESLGSAAETLCSALAELGAFDAATRAAQACASGAVLRRRLHTWFDGFRTLKLVHVLRRRGLSSLPLRSALTRAPWLASGLDGTPVSSASPVDLNAALCRIENARDERLGVPFHIG